MKHFYFFLLISIALLGCNHFEYSPNQTFDRNSFTDVNASNLKKLGDGAQDDTVRFILTGDTQRSRDETVEFYKKVNAMKNIDFVILAGDISEFGVLKEMEWIARSLRHLEVPYISVIGNHDLTSRGRETFEHMFGPLNFSFVYGGIKFICHDTNGREYNFNGKVPDMPWLREQLKPTAGVNNIIAVSHVPPSAEDFDRKLEDEYVHTFNSTPGFIGSLHAHTHSFEVKYPEDAGIPYLVTGNLGAGEFLIVEVVNQKLSFERVFF